MEQERKTENLHLRLTPTEKEIITQNAALLNVTVNRFITNCITRKRIVVCEGLPDLITALSKIGNNINQIARIANTTRRISDSSVDEVKKLMEDCYGKLDEFLEFINEPSEEVTQRAMAFLPETLSEIKIAIQMLDRKIDSKQ